MIFRLASVRARPFHHPRLTTALFGRVVMTYRVTPTTSDTSRLVAKLAFVAPQRPVRHGDAANPARRGPGDDAQAAPHLAGAGRTRRHAEAESRRPTPSGSQKTVPRNRTSPQRRIRRRIDCCHVEVHPKGGSEPSLRQAVADEADRFVELERVPVCRDLDSSDPTNHATAATSLMRSAADSAAHPLRVNEEIIELERVRDRPRRREPDDPSVSDRNPGSLLRESARCRRPRPRDAPRGSLDHRRWTATTCDTDRQRRRSSPAWATRISYLDIDTACPVATRCSFASRESPSS